MSFLGFTNATAGAPCTNAVFRFDQIPEGENGWWINSVEYWGGTKWIFSNEVSSASFDWLPAPIGTANHKHNAQAFGCTVSLFSTSAPVRVVVGLVRVPNRLVRALDRIWTASSKAFGSNPHGGWTADREMYFMTNEFNFPSADKAP
jgi:hypothetical protein